MFRFVGYLLIFIFVFSGGVSASDLLSWEEVTGKPGGTGPTAIVLVHGFQTQVLTDNIYQALHAEKWLELRRRIAEHDEIEDQVEFFVFFYNPYFDDIPTLAGEFSEQLEEHIKPEREIVIIAHSMGGLLARYYINQLDGHEQIQGLFTLGSPHQGIPLPFSDNNLFLRPAVQDLQGTAALMERFGFLNWEKTGLMQELNKNEKYADRYYSFSGLLDPDAPRNFFSYLGEAYYQLISFLPSPGDGVVSNFSSFLDGASNFPPVKGAHHHGLFEDQKIIESIIAGLQTLLLDKRFSVSGRITDERGKGLAGVKVKIGEEIVVTDEQGFYLSSREQEFASPIKPLAPEGKSWEQEKKLVDGREGGYDFQQIETHTLAGRVSSFFAEQDPEENILLLSNMEDHQGFYKVELGSAGSFRIDGVRPGSYRLFLFNQARPGLSLRELEVEGSKKDLEISFFHLQNNNY